jgi:hypothetical protein
VIEWQPSGPQPGREHCAIPSDPAVGLPKITPNRPSSSLAVIILTGYANHSCHPCHGA